MILFRVKRLAFVFLFITVLFLLSSAIAYAQQLEKITVATTAESVSDIPILYGIEKGLFKKEGLEPHFHQMPGNLSLAAMATGEVDYTAHVGTPFRAAIKGFPVKVLAVSLSRPLFYIISQPTITSPKDLKGKLFAVGSLQGTATRTAKAGLKALGLDPNKDMTLIVIGLTSIRMAAMETGSVAATVMSPPWNTRMKQKGFKELIFAGKDISEPVIGIGASREKVAKDPKQVKRVLRAFLRSLSAVKQDEQQVIEFTSRRFKLDPRVAKEVYEAVLLGLTRDGTLDLLDMPDLVEEVKKEMGVTNDIMTSDLLDFRLLREAGKEIGM
jgi:ABC-type nitrate/sulfonate/bicarbonate transport system substrate-binding protein